MRCLLTGFPGFIGTRLVRALLADADVVLDVLVEPRMVQRARAAAADLGDRVRLLEGDITEPRLGLDEDTYRDLATTVVRVYHLAAVYDLAVPESIAARVNIAGTRNVLDLCRGSAHLERLHYVSTCYVGGERTGVVLESELDEGQGFKNHYEATKFAAEVLVRDSMGEVPATIHRPGIVVGDSRTGQTQRFDGPYFILWFIHRMNRFGLTVGSMGSGAATFNAVPVDFVVDAIVACSYDPLTVGATLHLADPDPLTTAEFVRVLSRELTGKDPRGPAIPDALMRAALGLGPVRRYLGGTPYESLVFLRHPVRYDTTEATRHLGRNGLACPPFARYAPVMVDFFRRNLGNEELRAPVTIRRARSR
ncbi:NAD-dependent epimerase/dehydratase family protein [Occultella glacieicola]|uniref:NAD-dependent epimerase/dehydratase family protein n=1 Tax=Occultella glacieicola TaxID=2518684 RepID=A0ABY2E8K2_9MICO|nr:SDR family oxidoreductase [Occultella glacieicola]TDE97317.1 NAD-dependent epimerase/dehydratase family protein [Occultella glacieicola]